MSGTLDAPAAITCFILSLGLIQPILQALGYTDSLAMMDSTLKEGFRLAGQAGNGAPFQLRAVARAWDRV